MTLRVYQTGVLYYGEAGFLYGEGLFRKIDCELIKFISLDILQNRLQYQFNDFYIKKVTRVGALLADYNYIDIIIINQRLIDLNNIDIIYDVIKSFVLKLTKDNIDSLKLN